MIQQVAEAVSMIQQVAEALIALREGRIEDIDTVRMLEIAACLGDDGQEYWEAMATELATQTVLRELT